MVKRLDKETHEERDLRKSRSSGTQIVSPIENCTLVEFLGELDSAGYRLVDAFYKERIDAKDTRCKRKYHMVRFLFAHPDFVKISDEFKKVDGSIHDELLKICLSALWRVRAFSNPFYENGEEVANQGVISINLEARNPLNHPDGQPVMVWQKDERGNRMGDAPLPLVPQYSLHLGENSVVISVVPV